jgi:hypothetical protein
MIVLSRVVKTSVAIGYVGTLPISGPFLRGPPPASTFSSDPRGENCNPRAAAEPTQYFKKTLLERPLVLHAKLRLFYGLRSPGLNDGCPLDTKFSPFGAQSSSSSEVIAGVALLLMVKESKTL